MTRSEAKIDFSEIIGKILRIGVVTSFVIIVAGSILLFAEGQTGYYPLGNAQQLFDRHNRFLIGLVPLIQGVVTLKPYAVIELGMIVLLATPIMRVLVSIPLFFHEKRYVFVLITTIVLILLMFSTFVVGPLLAG